MALVRERLKQVLEGAKWQKGAHAGQQTLLTESIPPLKKVEESRTYVHFIFPSFVLRAKQCKRSVFQEQTRAPPPPGAESRNL